MAQDLISHNNLVTDITMAQCDDMRKQTQSLCSMSFAYQKTRLVVSDTYVFMFLYACDQAVEDQAVQFMLVCYLNHF